MVGDSSAASAFTALARVVVGKLGASGAAACTGVLVAPRLVLTATECVNGTTDKLAQPSADRPVLATFSATGASQTIEAVGIRYDSVRGLALIGLSRTPTKILPVPLGTTAPAVGENLVVAGMGRTSGDWVTDTPHQAPFAVSAVDASIVRLAGPGTLCDGDAGAALLRQRNDGTVELVGIAVADGGKGCLGNGATGSGGTAQRTTDLAKGNGLFKGDMISRSLLTSTYFGDAAKAAAAFGSAIVSGDFNNDGYRDVVVGAPHDMGFANRTTGAITVYGGTAAGLDAGHRLGQPGTSIDFLVGDGFGSALAVGDFNKDGFADLVVGNPTETVGDPEKLIRYVDEAGELAIYYGSTTGIDAATQISQKEIGLVAEEGDHFGAALAVGDFNLDGYADLAVGAPGEATDGQTARSGSVAVLKGTASGLKTGWSIDQSMTGDSNEKGDLFGAALAAGNVTGSAHADLVIGAPGEALGSGPVSGAIYVVPGAAAGHATGFGRTQSGNGGANEAGDEFGAALAVANLDKDGYADVIVGTPGEQPGSDPKSGTAYVFSGAASQLATGVGFGESSVGAAGLAGDRFGSSLAVGDVDADGYADVLIGAPGRTVEGLASAGAAFLFRGRARTTATTLPLVGARGISRADVIGENAASDGFGTALALADLDRDGRADALAGIPGAAVPTKARAGLVGLLYSENWYLTTITTDPIIGKPASGTSILEKYAYPNADQILAEQHVKLVSGNGKIMIANCAKPPDGDVTFIYVYTSDLSVNGGDSVCFRVLGTPGVLTMEVPAVFEIRGDGRVPGSGDGHDVTAVVRPQGGESTTIQLDSDGSTPVGIGSDPPGPPTTLLQLTAKG